MGKTIATIMDKWNDGDISTIQAMNAFANLLEENKGRACVKTWSDAIKKCDPYHEHLTLYR